MLFSPSRMIKTGGKVLGSTCDELSGSQKILTTVDHSLLHKRYCDLDQAMDRYKDDHTSISKAIPRAIQISRWLKQVNKLNEDVLRKSRVAKSTRISLENEQTIMCELENMQLDPTECCAEAPVMRYNPEEEKQLFRGFIEDIMLDESTYHATCNFTDRDSAKRVVGYVDLKMSTIMSDKAYRHLRRRTIHLAKKLCERHGIYPTSFVVPRADVRKVGEMTSRGASGCVWQGVYGEIRVALKEFVRTANGPLSRDDLKSFCREVTVWKYLDHPNITKCHGVLGQRAPLCIVSSWMANGTLESYLESHREASRMKLVRDIVAGLCYLHEMGLVHGDLKSLNILVDENGTACLADFGFAAFCYNEHTEFISKASVQGHTPRWAAPELLDADIEPCPTMESDVYSLSMVMWEVFTGRVPFYQIRSIQKIQSNILHNKRPERPLQALGLGLTSEVWGIMERCWQHDPKARPPITEVQELLDDVLRSTNHAIIEVPVVWPLELS